MEGTAMARKPRLFIPNDSKQATQQDFKSHVQRERAFA
jgi:hypothetical protein